MAIANENTGCVYPQTHYAFREVDFNSPVVKINHEARSITCWHPRKNKIITAPLPKPVRMLMNAKSPVRCACCYRLANDYFVMYDKANKSPFVICAVDVYREGNIPVAYNTLTIDHIIPKALGGPNSDWNLEVHCLRCNQTKGCMYTPNLAVVDANLGCLYFINRYLDILYPHLNYKSLTGTSRNIRSSAAKQINQLYVRDIAYIRPKEFHEVFAYALISRGTAVTSA
jgi:hypothetical protein